MWARPGVRLLEELLDTLGQEVIKTQRMVGNCHRGLKLFTCLTVIREVLGKILI